MTKKLVALALAAIMTASTNVSALSEADFAQTIEEVKNFVAVAKEKGLTEKGLTEEEVEKELVEALAEATSAPTVSSKNKRIGYLVIAGGALVLAGGIGWGLGYAPEWTYKDDYNLDTAKKKSADLAKDIERLQKIVNDKKAANNNAS